MPMIWPETAMALARARTGVAPEAGAALGVKILLLQDEAAGGEGSWIFLAFIVVVLASWLGSGQFL